MTAATSVLAELEQRAGASDADRPAWLAERAAGVTATEIRDLYLGTITTADLIRKKLAGDSFAGNSYTRWGTEREPVIAALLEERSGIRPESRVFHASDEPRFLASPDGIGEDPFDGLLISEIKTSGKPIPTNSDLFAQKGYGVQMTWAMRVTGARRCLYAWELRGGTPQDGFSAGRVSFEWVKYDAALADRLERIAVVFLGLLDEALEMGLEAWEAAEASAVTVDDVIDTEAVNLLRFRTEEAAGKKAKEASWKRLQELLAAKGGDVSQETSLARVTYTAAKTVEEEFESTDVDMEAAMAADHGLWTELQDTEARAAVLREQWDAHAATHSKTTKTKRTTTVKASLTVTAPKSMKETKA